jgi:hypothetical protein
MHVARLDPAFWTPSLFRDLSFDASSFDAVELAFEQLAQAPADLFLQKLYDWNLYAAGYALAQRGQGDTPVGAEMRTVILAMLADKSFDPVVASRQRAADALRLMQIEEAAPFQEATTLVELCAVVDAVGSDVAWFNEWKEVFRISEIQAIRLATLAKITEGNSILGWTVANVAKRVTDGGWILPEGGGMAWKRAQRDGQVENRPRAWGDTRAGSASLPSRPDRQRCRRGRSLWRG